MSRMNPRRGRSQVRCAFFLLSLSTLTAGTARASLPELTSLGTRSPALAGTGVAEATGYEATYQNPAGLATGTRNLTLGLVYGGYRTTIDGEPYPIENTLGIVIGGALPLGTQVCPISLEQELAAERVIGVGVTGADTR